MVKFFSFLHELNRNFGLHFANNYQNFVKKKKIELSCFWMEPFYKSKFKSHFNAKCELIPILNGKIYAYDL